MKLIKAVLGISLISGMVLILGCGDSTQSSTEPVSTNGVPVISEQAKNLDPCSLLTKEDVQGVIGQDIQNPERQGTSCSYTSLDTSKFQNILVIGQAGTRDDFDYQKKVLGDANTKDVSGIGDAAMFLSDSKLVVLKKDVLIDISGFGLSQDNLKDLGTKAADKVS